MIVDSTTISPEASAEVAAEAESRGSALLAAPVSGNPKVVAAGLLTFVVSAPEAPTARSLPFIEQLGNGVTYVGEGERARLVKICHNLMLGVVAQSLAEIVVLAEKGGVSRADFMEFLNDSVMGSMFTRYKTPAVREPGLQAHVHAGRCCSRTSTSASRRRASTASRCRSPRRPSRSCRR